MTNYWFYILKGFDNEGISYNLEMNVFIADTRDIAKCMLSEKFPDTPFRKPKVLSENTKYLYVTPSNQYWYDYHNKEYTLVCECCEKMVTVVGEKNIIRSKLGEFCSIECKEQREKEVGSNNTFINKNDHFGLGSYSQDELVGYIYKITNKYSMSCYVGQTSNAPLFRWWEHLKIDKKFDQIDIADLVFEVLEVVTFNEVDNGQGIYSTAKDKLNKREAYYINLYDCVNEGFNEVQPKEVIVDLFNYQTIEGN